MADTRAICCREIEPARVPDTVRGGGHSISIHNPRGEKGIYYYKTDFSVNMVIVRDRNSRSRGNSSGANDFRSNWWIVGRASGSLCLVCMRTRFAPGSFKLHRARNGFSASKGLRVCAVEGSPEEWPSRAPKTATNRCTCRRVYLRKSRLSTS